MRCFLVLALVGLGGAAAACGPTESKDGAEIFTTICANCHGPDGKPPADKIATLNVRDLTSPGFRSRCSVELVEKQVRLGSQNKLMPPFGGALRPDQITAVAEYVNARFHR